MLFSRGVNCGRTAGRIEMPLGKNFRRPQIFSLEISGPKIFFYDLAKLFCLFCFYHYMVNKDYQSGPTLQIFVVPGGPGPEAAASPASWMIRPWVGVRLGFFVCLSVRPSVSLSVCVWVWILEVVNRCAFMKFWLEVGLGSEVDWLDIDWCIQLNFLYIVTLSTNSNQIWTNVVNFRSKE